MTVMRAGIDDDDFAAARRRRLRTTIAVSSPGSGGVTKRET